MTVSISPSSGYLKSYEYIDNQPTEEATSGESFDPAEIDNSYPEEMYTDAFEAEDSTSWEDSNAMTPEAALDKITELFDLLRGSDLIGNDRQRLSQELQDLKTQFLNGNGEPPPASIDAELTAIEAEILGKAPPESGEPDPKEAVQKQIEGLLETLDQNEKISTDRAQALKTKIERMKSALELSNSPEESDEIANQLTALEQEVLSYESSSDSANRIASSFNKSPVEVTSAAEAAGLDLDNLPEQPDDQVINFIKETGYFSASHMESYTATLDSRKEKIKTLDDKIAANAKAIKDFQSGKSDEYVEPNVKDYTKLVDYGTKQDPDFRRMQKDIDVIMEQVTQGLEDLGYKVEAGRTGPFSLIVNGQNYFLDPATGSLGNKEPQLMP